MCMCVRETQRDRDRGLEVLVCYGKYVEVIGQPTAASGDKTGHEVFTISEI